MAGIVLAEPVRGRKIKGASAVELLRPVDRRKVVDQNNTGRALPGEFYSATAMAYDDAMKPIDIKGWIEIVQGLVTLAATLIGGFWAWSRFVVERGLIPPSQMDLALQTIGSSELATIVEIAVRLQNKGSSALIVSDLRIRLRYLNDDDEIQLIDAPAKAAFGRVNFPHAHVLNRIGAEERVANARMRDHYSRLGRGEFLLVPHDTFVQPGVDQLYTFATALPRSKNMGACPKGCERRKTASL